MEKNIEHWIGIVRDNPKNQLGCLMIYNSHQSFVRSVLMKMLKMPDVTDELTSIVFMKIFNKLKLYESHTSFKAWVHRMTVNTAIDFLRVKQKSYETISTDEASCFMEIICDQQNAQEAIESKELQQKIDKTLNILDPKHKEILELRFQCGLSYEEISKALAIPVGTVKSRLSNARKAFKQSY